MARLAQQNGRPDEQKPRLVSDLLGEIKAIPAQQESQRRQAELAEESRKRKEELAGRKRSLWREVRAVYPKKVTIENFEILPLEGRSYPAVRIGVDRENKVELRRLCPEREVTVVLTDQTTDTQAMASALKTLKSAGSLNLLVEWDFEFDKEFTRVTKAEVKRLLTGPYKTESHDYDGDVDKARRIVEGLPDGQEQNPGQVAAFRDYDRMDVNYFKPIYDRTGDKKDSTRILFIPRSGRLELSGETTDD